MGKDRKLRRLVAQVRYEWSLSRENEYVDDEQGEFRRQPRKESTYDQRGP